MWLKLIALACGTVSSLFIIKRYFGGKYCSCTTKLNDSVIVVTGANSGIGKSTALELAKRGAKVILACRNIKKAEDTCKEIISETGNKNIVCIELDLTSLDSIRHFVDVLKTDYTELHALINNAGVFYHEQQLTKDGFDVTLQTNYLGPVYLTLKLLPLLKKSKQARIVNVCSKSHTFPSYLDVVTIVQNPTSERCHYKAYGVSKLALLLFTKSLASVLYDTNITVHAVDPGNCETSIYRYFPFLNNRLLFAIQKPIRFFVIKTPLQGAQSIIHVVLCEKYSKQSGLYVVNREEAKPNLNASEGTDLEAFLCSYFCAALKIKIINKNVE